MDVSTRSVPEQGQLVRARARNWVVAQVAASTSLADPLRPGRDCAQHPVTLTSVEDDGLGDRAGHGGD